MTKYAPWLLTLLLGVAAFLFWWLRYPFALSYQEQFQLFLFDDDYFWSRVSEPGGLARYVSEFLVQFYNNVMLGAAIIALLYMLMQRLLWRLIRLQLPSDNAPLGLYLLSFAAPLLAWYVMGDVNLLLAFPVAVVLVEAAMLSARCLTGAKWYYVALALLVAVPLVYWFCGPVVLMLAVYVPLAQRPRRLACWLLAAGAVVYAVFCVLVSSFLLPYTVTQLFCGLGYYRYFEALMLLMVVLPVVIVALPLGLPLLWRSGQAPRLLSSVGGVAGVLAVVTLVAVLTIPRAFDEKTYELIEYDYLVRTQQWDAVIAKAEQENPDLPMSVCATNLALAMKEQLTERAFDFYQRGSEGLLPKFERNYTTTLVTGEAYFQLGLINTAQRFAFEAMEAIPNYNKSARCVRRLAETNLINGHYAVARKYLAMLKKTMFYRKWAERTEALLENEQQLNAHPLYGKLRSMRPADDFLYSDRELDKICGQLLMANNSNLLATQYLLMFPVLQGDVSRFMNYYQYVQQQMPGYAPRVCQEMTTFAYASRRQQPPRGTVPDAMLQQFNQFMQAYRNSGSIEAWRHTAWYYLVKQ